VLGTVLLAVLPDFGTSSSQDLSYSAFVTQVTANKVATATISGSGAVTGTLVEGGAYTSQLPTALGDAGLAALLAAHNVEVTATNPDSGSLVVDLLSFLPFVLLIGYFVWLMRRGGEHLGTGGGMLGIGQSRATVYDETRPGVRFADIAGYEGSKAEVMEVVDFLRSPERYRCAGAKGPKGVLMIGPPGTGKTLMARAVAGEAAVPFFSISGSGFVEMFVGVGASRVRSLFEEARKRAPSIVFIDEIDAIGGRRGRGGFGANDEREQTLNQLLSEMDGFEPGSGVVVVAATNRPETLDAALLRPGRFDRTVEIPLPNQAERAAILAIHGRDKTLAPDVDLDAVSRATPGFSGADLANLVNEAAINAVRADRAVVTAADLDAARDRLLLGRREESNALLPAEKNAVAVHEAGHALVAALCTHADPVAKVTILPRGASLGATEQLPRAERRLYPLSYLTESLAVRLGGRAAELVVLGEASSGASHDLASATELATRMVREWGLSTELGPLGYGSTDGRQIDRWGSRPYAEQTQRTIDQEVARLLGDALDTAVGLLRDHRDVLDRLVALLLDHETIDGAAVTAALAASTSTPVPTVGVRSGREAEVRENRPCERHVRLEGRV
jgi:cell division protease FtsH